MYNVVELKNMQINLDVTYESGKTPWQFKCDMAFPSATQNEINKDDAKTLS